MNLCYAGFQELSFTSKLRSQLLLTALVLTFICNMISPVFATPVNDKYLPTIKKSLMFDVAVVDGVAVVVGEQGFVLLSTDSGENWKQVEVPANVALTGVYFHDAKLGWAVGYDHVIIRTRDGGKNWELLYSETEADGPLLDVFFLDAKNGFAIGAYGAFLTTADGGDSWNKGQLNLVSVSAAGSNNPEDEEFTDYHLNQIAKSNSGKLYIAAEGGHMYRSDDNGLNWVSLSSPYIGSFFGVLPIDGESLLMFGLRGNLFRSSDSGKNWLKVDTGTKTLLACGFQLLDGTVLVSGNGGVVLYSNDGGCSFKLQQLPQCRGVSAGTLVDADSLLFVGAFGVKKITVDKLNLSN